MVPYKIGDTSGVAVSAEVGLDRLHMEAVTIVQKDRITQVSSAGVAEALGPDGLSLSGRGSSICLTFWSECGNRIFVTYQFHKGEVYFTFSEPEVLNEEVASTELWRD